MNIFKGKKVVIATKHHKQDVIAPILERELHVTCFTPDNFDTNKFGTFTRTKKRKKTQLQTAIQKAKEALKISETEAEIAIASEGSFSNSESAFIQTNLELVLLYYPKFNLTVYGVHSAHSPNLRGEYAFSTQEALNIATQFDFPNHGIVLRTKPNSRKILTEEITNISQLESYLQNHFLKNKKIFIETDMRAHRNPSRMQNIKLATKNLLQKLKTHCPNCNLPGYGVTNYQKGLPCQICHRPTSQKMSQISSCSACNFTQANIIDPKLKADPSYCSFCNP